MRVRNPEVQAIGFPTPQVPPKSPATPFNLHDGLAAALASATLAPD